MPLFKKKIAKLSSLVYLAWLDCSQLQHLPFPIHLWQRLSPYQDLTLWLDQDHFLLLLRGISLSTPTVIPVIADKIGGRVNVSLMIKYIL